MFANSVTHDRELCGVVGGIDTSVLHGLFGFKTKLNQFAAAFGPTVAVFEGLLDTLCERVIHANTECRRHWRPLLQLACTYNLTLVANVKVLGCKGLVAGCNPGMGCLRPADGGEE